MDKLAFILRILSILILVGPLLAVVCIYSGNPSGLVLTPELKNLASGDLSKSQFQLPQPVGNPTFDAATGVYTFSFKFTNPLGNEIAVSRITADVYCKTHNVALGSMAMAQPITIASGETVTVQAQGTWTQQALEHFAAYHNGSEDDDINVSFKNLNVDLAGVSIHMAVLEDAGWVMMPK